jgi:hypothetical protein
VTGPALRPTALVPAAATVTAAAAVMPVVVTLSLTTTRLAVGVIGLAVTASALLANRELRERARHNRRHAFDAGKLRANQRTMAPSGGDGFGLWLGDGLRCRDSDGDGRALGLGNRFLLGLGRDVLGLENPGQHFVIERAVLVTLLLRGRLRVFVRMLRVAGRAPGLLNILPGHDHNGMVRNASFARTVVVYDIAETQRSLLHQFLRTVFIKN